MKIIYCITCFISLLLIGSCIKSNVFEKNIDIQHQTWHYQQTPQVTFNIHDTAASYQIYLTIKHTNTYKYKNIWLRIYTQNPGEQTITTSDIEVPLAEESGKWLGRSFKDIVIQQMPLQNNGIVKFTKQGVYTIKLEQIMRDNPLLGVMSVGLRIEKI